MVMHSGVVLCGGLSSRMGRAKALLPWRGRTMVAHVTECLLEIVDDVVVVSSEELDLADSGLGELGARIVIDREPKLGPLGGIREGLAAARGELVFVTGTDAPFLSQRFVACLLAQGGAAAPEVDGFVQSMAAVYSRASLDVAERLIASERMRPLFLLEESGYCKVPADELVDLDSLRGFNTPEAYLDAVRAEPDPAPAIVELLGLARSRVGSNEVTAAPGHLRDLLEGVSTKDLQLCTDGDVAPNFLVSLNGVRFLRDGSIPIGPGDRVIVMDASVGG